MPCGSHRFIILQCSNSFFYSTLDNHSFPSPICCYFSGFTTIFDPCQRNTQMACGCRRFITVQCSNNIFSSTIGRVCGLIKISGMTCIPRLLGPSCTIYYDSNGDTYRPHRSLVRITCFPSKVWSTLPLLTGSWSPRTAGCKFVRAFEPFQLFLLRFTVLHYYLPLALR